MRALKSIHIFQSTPLLLGKMSSLSVPLVIEEDIPESFSNTWLFKRGTGQMGEGTLFNAFVVGDL